MKAEVVKLFMKTDFGRVGSKILEITPNASDNVGIRKNIQAKFTIRNVMTILTAFPNHP